MLAIVSRVAVLAWVGVGFVSIVGLHWQLELGMQLGLCSVGGGVLALGSKCGWLLDLVDKEPSCSVRNQMIWE
jgi:hypothetical protein